MSLFKRSRAHQRALDKVRKLEARIRAFEERDEHRKRWGDELAQRAAALHNRENDAEWLRTQLRAAEQRAVGLEREARVAQAELRTQTADLRDRLRIVDPQWLGAYEDRRLAGLV